MISSDIIYLCLGDNDKLATLYFFGLTVLVKPFSFLLFLGFFSLVSTNDPSDQFQNFMLAVPLFVTPFNNFFDFFFIHFVHDVLLSMLAHVFVNRFPLNDTPFLPHHSTERQRTADAYNLEEFDKLDCEGKYQMPKLHSVDYVPNGFIGFNEMLTSKDHDKGVHFYVDDYQFERIWNKPTDYLQRLFEFDCMLTPDFSLYTEMPLAMQIWNTYRSRLIGQMGQRMGMIVIPTVSWCREDSFEFCFDGLPKKSTLSVSTMGVKQEEYNFSLWASGMDAMIERLKPERLLIYGGEVPYDYGNIEIVYYSNNVLERMKKKGEE